MGSGRKWIVSIESKHSEQLEIEYWEKDNGREDKNRMGGRKSVLKTGLQHPRKRNEFPSAVTVYTTKSYRRKTSFGLRMFEANQRQLSLPALGPPQTAPVVPYRVERVQPSTRTVPVGAQVLGRVLDVDGLPLDKAGALDQSRRAAIRHTARTICAR